MKKYLYVVFLIVLFLSCNSNPTSPDESEVPVVIENLTGQWNWTQSVDSTNQIVDEPTSDVSRSMIITQDYTCKELLNDTVILDDTFRLQKYVLTKETDSLSYMDWEHSKYFNYVIFSLTPKRLVVGCYTWGHKKIFSRIN